MSLDAARRRRYERQLLLGEIGETGQERLMSVPFRANAGSDEDALAVASDYLVRAGCSPGKNGAELRVPNSGAVSRFAGSDAFREAAAAVVGAFYAVEHLKAVLGVGEPGDLPSELSLSAES